jgi:nucleotide-binding universal stress UspA family protein
MPYSKPTLRFGSLLAALEPSEVTLLTVVGKKEDEPPAEALLREARQLLDVPVTGMKIRRGSAVEQIIAESREGNYDTIVVGFRVAGGLLDGIWPSVTRKVTRDAPGSVLVVKGESVSLRRILICTGGRQISRSVVKAGAMLARAANAEAKLLYVTDPVPAMYAGLEGIEETLPELLHTDTPIARHLRWGAELLASYEVSAEVMFQQGIAAAEILQAARDNQSDLIVIGAQVENGGWLDDLLIPTVTPQVVDHAPCSVLVVRRRL